MARTSALDWGWKHVVAAAAALIAGSTSIVTVWTRLNSQEAFVVVVCVVVFVMALAILGRLLHQGARAQGARDVAAAAPPRTEDVLDAALVSTDTTFVRSHTIAGTADVCLSIRIQGISDVPAKPVRMKLVGAVFASGASLRFEVDYPIVAEALRAGATHYVPVETRAERFWHGGPCPESDCAVNVETRSEITYAVPDAGFQTLSVASICYVQHRVAID